MKRLFLGLVLIFAHTNATWLLASLEAEAEGARPESQLIPIKYARAEEIASVLNRSDAVAASFKNRIQMTVNLAALEAEIKSLGPRKVAADERSNSLLVSALPADLERINGIIDELDVALGQLLIEAVIIRLPIQASRRLDVRSEGTPDPCPVLSRLTHFRVLPATRLVSVNRTNGLGMPGSELSYVARFSGDLDAAINVLATNIEARILQRPRIQTSRGVSASLFVAGSYPIYSGSSFYQSIQALSTNRSMIDLTYSITKEGFFLTDIQQEVEMFTGNVYIANVGQVPTTRKIQSQAHIVVRDRETIVLGGLIDTVETPIFSEISLLNQIPRVGNFLNKLITYPTRKVSYEIIALIRPRMLPVPELPANSRMPLVRPADAEVQAEELGRFQSTAKNP